MKIRLGKATLVIGAVILIFGLWHVPGPNEALGQESAAAARMRPDRDYNLGAGDLVQVVVWKNEDLSGEYRVRPDGKFSMPLIGDILAEGSTTDGVSMQVEQKLKLFIDSPYVSTIVIEATSNRVYILGEVVKPGTYSIDGSLTVLQAVALAGGFTQFAKTSKIVVLRRKTDGEVRINVDYDEIVRASKSNNNILLVRGDTVIVP